MEPRPDPSPFRAVFKAYDVRGTVPDQLNGDMAWAIGAAFADFVSSDGATRVVIGRDMRESGVALSRAFAAGVLRQGLGVVDAGMISTDLLYFASGSLDAPGAMLTASHNPAGYNGIKMCRSGARPIGQETGLADIEKSAARLLAQVPTADEQDELLAGEAYETADLLEAFAEHVRSFLTAEIRPLKVVADTANGMGGLVAPAVFAGLPVDLEILYGDLDGSFPNHPADPIQLENLKDLRARVLEVGADVGLAFDGDADRVFLVDEEAEPLSGSLTTAIVAAAMLETHPCATILYNLICSKAVPEIVREKGGIPVRTRVGHSFIKATMAETGALFGGEHSGHYYFEDNFRADSGIIAALVVLGVMSAAGQPLSELRRPFERYADSGEINTEVGDADQVLAGMRAHFETEQADIDTLDGLTIDLGDWWFNLRPSNTEPLLRLNLEAANEEECRRHLDEVLGLIGELDRPGDGEGSDSSPDPTKEH